MRKIHSNHAVFSLGYHIIWCPKYRHHVLDGAIATELKQIIAQTCAAYGWGLEAIEIMPDHVHLFITATPEEAPGTIAKTLKSISAVYLFEKFSKLKGRRFWGSGLWSPSTFYATVGGVSDAAIKDYIANQKTYPRPRGAGS